MSWLPGTPSGESGLGRVFRLRANLYEDYLAFRSLLLSDRFLDLELLRLVWLRVVSIFGHQGERRRGREGGSLELQKLAALDDWRGSRSFAPVERAALALAERFVLDPRGGTEGEAEALAESFSAKELVALAEALAFFDGFTRFAIILQCEPDDPFEATVNGPRRSRPVLRSEADGVVTAAPLRVPAPVVPPDGIADEVMRRSVLAHQPELLRAFLKLYGTLWSRGIVDHPSKEVARLRNARITDCRYCRNVRFSKAREDGLSEEMVSLIDEGFEESSLSDRHKTLIRYADLFLAAPAVPSAILREGMLRHFSPAEIVELTAGLALFMGFSKIAIVLGQEPRDMPTTVISTPI